MLAIIARFRTLENRFMLVSVYHLADMKTSEVSRQGRHRSDFYPPNEVVDTRVNPEATPLFTSIY